MTEPPVLKDEYDNVIVVLDSRFRMKGGSVVHRAAVQEDENSDGFHVVVMCKTDFIQWFRDGEDERLDLIQPDDAEVTCKTCKKITERLQKQQEKG